MPLINYLQKSKGFIEKKTWEAVRKITLSLRPGLSVLMYHRITRTILDPQLLVVTPEKFEEQIVCLKQKNRLLTIKQFDEIIKTNGVFPPRSVLITFDDGYADNYKEALPILERVGAEAIFFISTGNIGTRKEFWWDNLERIFVGGPVPPKLSIQVGEKTYNLPTENARNRTFAYRQLHTILKTLNHQTREGTVNKLLTWANLTIDGRDTHRSMTEDEVRLLSKSSAARIGAHTKNHVMLSSLSEEEQKTEIADSKDILEKMTGGAIRYFSYPFGGKDAYTKETVQICRNLGFTAAFSGVQGIARQSTDPFELPRVIARNWDISEFQNNI